MQKDYKRLGGYKVTFTLSSDPLALQFDVNPTPHLNTSVLP